MTRSQYNDLCRHIDVLERMAGILCDQIISVRVLLEDVGRKEGLLPVEAATPRQEGDKE
jgi:hypothetical protein